MVGRHPVKGVGGHLCPHVIRHLQKWLIGANYGDEVIHVEEVKALKSKFHHVFSLRLSGGATQQEAQQMQ